MVSVQEYLTTDYSPDCDYVDGRLEDRNVSEHDHGRLQGLAGAFLLALEKRIGTHSLMNQRVQVSPTRFRVPDLCVLLGRTREPILTQPPFLCIEILSPEDRMHHTRRAWVYTRDEIKEAKDGVLRTADPAIELSLAELFGEL